MKFLLKDHYQQNTTEGTREEPQIERGESVLKGSEIKKIGEFFMMVKAEIKLLKPGFEPQADMKLFKPRVRSWILGCRKTTRNFEKNRGTRYHHLFSPLKWQLHYTAWLFSCFKSF